MLNPTSCNAMTLQATVIGGGSDPTNPNDNNPFAVNDPFQTADCSSLQFKPSVAVSTAGKASKANGASLTFKIAYPQARSAASPGSSTRSSRSPSSSPPG